MQENVQNICDVTRLDFSIRKDGFFLLKIWLVLKYLFENMTRCNIFNLKNDTL